MKPQTIKQCFLGCHDGYIIATFWGWLGPAAVLPPSFFERLRLVLRGCLSGVGSFGLTGSWLSFPRREYRWLRAVRTQRTAAPGFGSTIGPTARWRSAHRDEGGDCRLGCFAEVCKSLSREKIWRSRRSARRGGARALSVRLLVEATREVNPRFDRRRLRSAGAWKRDCI